MFKKGDFARTNNFNRPDFEVFEVLEDEDENSIYLLMKPSHSVRNGTVVETELNKAPFSATLYGEIEEEDMFPKYYLKCDKNGKTDLEKVLLD